MRHLRSHREAPRPGSLAPPTRPSFASFRPCNHATLRPCEHATMRPCDHAGARGVAQSPQGARGRGRDRDAAQPAAPARGRGADPHPPHRLDARHRHVRGRAARRPFGERLRRRDASAAGQWRRWLGAGCCGQARVRLIGIGRAAEGLRAQTVVRTGSSLVNSGCGGVALETTVPESNG